MALLGLVLAGCAAVGSPTPTPSVAARVEPWLSCQGDRQTDVRSTPPDLPISVRIDDGQDSALLIAGPVPGDESLVYVNPCLIRRDETGAVVGAWAVRGSVAAPPDPSLSLDELMDETELVLAGRIGPTVARVEVTLDDGRRVDAALANGYYLAWWRGADTNPVRIEAFSAGGAEVRSLEDATGLKPPR